MQCFSFCSRTPGVHHRYSRDARLVPLCVLGLLVLGTAGCSRNSGAGASAEGRDAETDLRLEGAAAEVRGLTGARTRVVWVQGDGTDPYAGGDNLVLVGFDTDDGKGERVILGERGSYVKPQLTARGERIVYSTRPTQPGGPKVFVVNWDGSGRRHLADGFALTVWQDEKGRDWVYLGTDNTPEAQYNFRTVVRFPIDNPGAREVVWNKTPVSGDTFQVSRDGRVAGGLFPWPHAAVAQLPNGELRKFGEGCWTALRDPGAQLFWYFDGAHRNVTMVDVSADRRWTVSLNAAPGFGNSEVYHPRWTNHPRFVAISGPYNQGGTNQVRSGGKQSEIHLGRFAGDYSRIEAWARLTNNGAGDSYPDVWIETGKSPHPVRASGPVGPPAGNDGGTAGAAPAAADAGTGRLVVEARLASPGEIPPPRSILPYRNALVVSEYDVQKVVQGEYGARQILVAQWAIRDGRVIAGAQRSPGATARLTLERYDQRPELEGERLLASSGAPDLPVYYEPASLP